MASTLQCPSCSRKLRVPDDLVGKGVRCPGCLTTFTGAPQPDAAANDGNGAAAPEPPADDLPQDETPAPARETAALPPATPPSPPAADDSREETRPCPYCGERLGRHDERCRFCGEDLAEEEDRPWERRSGPPVRRDCEPHRGQLVLVLGIISIVCGAVSGAAMCCLPGVFSLVGLGLGIPAWVLGRRDLQKMNDGSMDPEGKGITQAGMICGIIGTILSGLSGLLGLGMIAYFVFALSLGMRSVPSAVPVAPPPAAPVAPPPAAPGKAPAGAALPRPHDYLPRLAHASDAAVPNWS